MVASITDGSSQNLLAERNCGRNLTNVVGKDAIMESKSLSNVYIAKVIDAYRKRRIFTVFGKYNILRKLLTNRGWLEKLPPDRFSNLQKFPVEAVLEHAEKGNDFETVIISKTINNLPAFFVWQSKGQIDLYQDVLPYRNRLRMPRHLDFSTKVGLLTCADQQHWYRQEGMAGMTHPRFFRLGENQEEHLAFIADYRITQCCSLLRYLVENRCKRKEISDHESGTIEKTVLQFAIAQVQRKLDDCADWGFVDAEELRMPEKEWDWFLKYSTKIINDGKKFKCGWQDLAELIETSKSLLMKIEEKQPDLKWDGYKNLWILKPGYMNRGRGIVIFNNLGKILQWGMTYPSRHYIVQKYIGKTKHFLFAPL